MLFSITKWTFFTALLISNLCLIGCGKVKFSGTDNKNNSENANQNNNGGNNNSNTTLRDVHYNNTVAATNNKVDVVLVIDDSNSMLEDNQKLASRLSGFVSRLESSNLDWQMCTTVTRSLQITATQSAWGASVYWQNSDTPTTSLGMVLKRTSGDLNTIFSKTIKYIGAGWAGSDDERAIKAIYHHVYNGDYHYQPNNGCYRSDSAIAYIIISDEDERSIGGEVAQQVYTNELKTLENEDLPDVVVSYIRSTFGNEKRFTVNSIIVKPNDSGCKATQDSSGVISHYGAKYAELSGLTSGGVGSICESDFSTNLNLFLDRIQNSLSSVPLECQPYNGNVTVHITPSAGQVTSRIDGMNLIFNAPISAGSTIDITYQCEETRSPSSIGTPVVEQLGFWDRISTFLKNLF